MTFARMKASKISSSPFVLACLVAITFLLTISYADSARADVIGKPTKVAVNNGSMCVLLDSKQIRCWGARQGFSNSSSMLGDGISSTENQETPVSVVKDSVSLAPVDDAIDLQSSSDGVYCALLENHEVSCWGNINAQMPEVGSPLGNGSNLSVNSASTKVINSDGEPIKAASISVGLYSSCAILFSDKVQCWGDNYAGQLGNGTTTGSLHATNVLISGSDQSGDVFKAKRISVGFLQTCATDLDDTNFCWGYNTENSLGSSQSASGSNVTNPIEADLLGSGIITPGYESSCVQGENSLACIGKNPFGAFGNGDTNDQPTPFVTPGVSAYHVEPGVAVSCIVVSEEYKCAGVNPLGALGFFPPNDGSFPVATSYTANGLTTSNTSQIDISTFNGCSLDSRFAVRCWGYGNFLGIGGGLRNGVTSSVLPLDPAALTGNISAPVEIAKPTITGQTKRGSVLTASSPEYGGSPANGSLSYQWQRENTQGYENISGATSSTYELTAAEDAKNVRVLVSGSNLAGTTVSTSLPVGIEKPKPASTDLPVVTGEVVEGQTLSTTNGMWERPAENSYSYQWLRNGVGIAGATNRTYLIVQDDVGAKLRVIVTATNTEGSGTAQSNETATVTAKPIVPPVVEPPVVVPPAVEPPVVVPPVVVPPVVVPPVVEPPVNPPVTPAPISCEYSKLSVKGFVVGKKKIMIVGGTARKFAGKTVVVRARYANKKIVGKSVVDSQGNFIINVKKPSRAIQNSKRAYYKVEVGGQKTRWLKVPRLLSVSIKSKGRSKLMVKGTLGKTYSNKSIQVSARYKCEGSKRFKSIRINSKGTFKKTLVMPSNAKYVEVFFSTKKKSSTYSIHQLVRIK